MSRITSEISSLKSSKFGDIEINHKLVLTMVDGKVCNAISQTASAMRCYICGASPIQMNNLNLLQSKVSNQEFYEFGLSPLHAKIKFFECLLHISYNLDFKKWFASTPEFKRLQTERKRIIHKKFRIALGLVVDRVKQGVGTFNDGNTARRFFSNQKKASEIIGIEECLIRRFAVILQAIASGQQINADLFDTYARETAEMFVSKYGWYYMPTTVHKVLIHGKDVGQLSEEAQEARNKDFRNFREHNSRKFNRSCTNEDIANRLLITSDPLISSIRPHFVCNIKKYLFLEVLDLLVFNSTSNIVSENS